MHLPPAEQRAGGGARGPPDQGARAAGGSGDKAAPARTSKKVWEIARIADRTDLKNDGRRYWQDTRYEDRKSAGMTRNSCGQWC